MFQDSTRRPPREGRPQSVQLAAASIKGWAGLAKETADWWHEFWRRGWVSLTSADGVAQNVARNYHYFLYLMASSSRGKDVAPSADSGSAATETSTLAISASKSPSAHRSRARASPADLRYRSRPAAGSALG